MRNNIPGHIIYEVKDTECLKTQKKYLRMITMPLHEHFVNEPMVVDKRKK